MLAGEGVTELGRFAHPLPYRDKYDAGVLEALVRRFEAGATAEFDGIPWRSIRAYRAGESRDRERRLVLGLSDWARSCGCTLVVLVRDRDGDPGRERAIRLAIGDPNRPSIPAAAGIAREEIECWLLALRGEFQSERSGRRACKERLEGELAVRDYRAKAAVVQSAEFESIPPDAESLRRFLDELEGVLETGGTSGSATDSS